MKNLKGILVGSAFALSMVLAIGSKAVAHNDGGYNPNHAHVCTMSTSLNIRSKPNGKVVGSVAKGYQVQVKGSYNNWETNEVWYEIYMPNSDKSGFVSGKYICF